MYIVSSRTIIQLTTKMGWSQPGNTARLTRVGASNRHPSAEYTDERRLCAEHAPQDRVRDADISRPSVTASPKVALTMPCLMRYRLTRWPASSMRLRRHRQPAVPHDLNEPVSQLLLAKQHEDHQRDHEA
jgi:hypothetical protein